MTFVTLLQIHKFIGILHFVRKDNIIALADKFHIRSDDVLNIVCLQLEIGSGFITRT